MLIILVIQILDSVYYVFIYTVKNLCNDFIILQDISSVKTMFFTCLSGIWYYLHFIAVPRLEPRYQPERQKRQVL